MWADTSQVHALAHDLSAAALTINGKAEMAVAKTAHDVLGTAETLVPVDTGYLKNSLSADVSGLDAEIGPTAEYGGYVELGTSRMSPQPYLAPAFDAHEGSLVDAIGHAGERIL